MMKRRIEYRDHAAFVEPAKARSELWRLIFGLVMAFAGMMAIGQWYYNIVDTAVGVGGDEAALSTTGNTALSALVLLFSFGAMTLAAFAVTFVLHGRRIGTLIGARRRVMSQFAAVTVMLVVLNVVIGFLPPWGYGAPLGDGLALGRWFVLLPIALLAILVQTSAEEILFRGYIQQQLAARFSHPVVWMVLPSALFALLHYQPNEAGENAWLLVLWAGVFGMAMADLTARSGSLGPAMAVHFVNNAIAFLFVSLPDDMSGLALYTTPFGLEDVQVIRDWLWVDFGFIVVSWLGARLAIRR